MSEAEIPQLEDDPVDEPPAERPERRRHPRKHPRLNKVLRVGFQIPEYEEPQGVYLSLVDLSEGGMRVSVDRMWPVDSHFELHFPLAGLGPNLPESVVLPCQCRWNKGLSGTWVHGLSFEELTDSEKSVVGTIMANFAGVGARRHYRLECFSPMTVVFDDEETIVIRIRNISAGGVGFRTKREFTQGEEFGVKLPFVALSFETRARIQWRKPLDGGLFEYGCSFPELRSEQQSEIEWFIKKSRKKRR